MSLAVDQQTCSRNAPTTAEGSREREKGSGPGADDFTGVAVCFAAWKTAALTHLRTARRLLETKTDIIIKMRYHTRMIKTHTHTLMVLQDGQQFRMSEIYTYITVKNDKQTKRGRELTSHTTLTIKRVETHKMRKKRLRSASWRVGFCFKEKDTLADFQTRSSSRLTIFASSFSFVLLGGLTVFVFRFFFSSRVCGSTDYRSVSSDT